MVLYALPETRPADCAIHWHLSHHSQGLPKLSWSKPYTICQRLSNTGADIRNYLDAVWVIDDILYASMSGTECSATVRYYKGGVCDSTYFDGALAAGVPLCIEGADAGLQGEWEPEAFVEKYGDLKVSPIDSLTDEEMRGPWTMRDFFGILGCGDTSHGTPKLKVSELLVDDSSLTGPPGLADKRKL